MPLEPSQSFQPSGMRLAAPLQMTMAPSGAVPYAGRSPGPRILPVTPSLPVTAALPLTVTLPPMVVRPLTPSPPAVILPAAAKSPLAFAVSVA